MEWPTGEMPALVFPRAREVSWQTVPIPVEAPGQVLVRIERLGICGTDVGTPVGNDGFSLWGLRQDQKLQVKHFESLDALVKTRVRK